MDKIINQSLNKLISYIEDEEYRGYDPYDILNSFIPFSLFGKYGQSIAIQAGKRIPYNFRPLIGIKKEYNPKGIGLLLNGYSILYKMQQKSEYLEKAQLLFKLLKELANPGYSGYCWGYNFVWANPVKKLPKYYPSVVVTSFVIKGIYEYYNITNDEEAIDLIKSASKYILNDIPVTKNENGICFSYTDIIKDTCYNASLLAAEVLAINYALTGNIELKERALSAVNFVIAYQKDDGRWNYSIDLNSNKEDEQIDFHQGFVIESIRNILMLTKITDSKYRDSILKGAKFYYFEQVVDGIILKYRWPKIYPIDIHNQAQAIITFSNLTIYDEKYMEYAKSILIWTIKNMQNKENGSFYYRKRKYFENKTPFMRWGQAWMLMAFSALLKNSKS